MYFKIIKLLGKCSLCYTIKLLRAYTNVLIILLFQIKPDTLFCAQVNLNVSCGSVFAAQSEFICLEFNVISYLSMIYNLFSPSTTQEFLSKVTRIKKVNVDKTI